MTPSFLRDFVFMSPDSLSKQYFGAPYIYARNKEKAKSQDENKEIEEIKVPWDV